MRSLVAPSARRPSSSATRFSLARTACATLRRRSSHNWASRSARRRERAPFGEHNSGRKKRQASWEGSLLTSEQAKPKTEADSIFECLPNRIHQVFDPYVAATPDSVALSED